jgi:dihydroneopterin aldolase/2-amino-4-hydroxy-6-hydroxymethyldihydropteridine diphosphokinase/dihydropteroate synthase
MKPQPVQASVRLQRNIHKAGMTDNVDETLSYSTMCKRILKTAQTFEEQDSQSLNQVTAFHTMLHSTVRDEKGPDRELGRLEIETTMPKAILGAAGLTFKSISEYSHTDSNNLVTSAGGLCINGLRGNCIIGVNPHERLHKQPVDIDLSYNFASIDPSKDNPQALAEAALKVGYATYSIIIAVTNHFSGH